MKWGLHRGDAEIAERAAESKSPLRPSPRSPRLCSELPRKRELISITPPQRTAQAGHLDVGVEIGGRFDDDIAAGARELHVFPSLDSNPGLEGTTV